MADLDQQELTEFTEGAAAWFKENTPRDVDFMLPLTFMEVGTDQQFNFLRDWQNKVYEAGYLGAHWPKEYGGGGRHRAFQDAATKIMAQERTPSMLNAIRILRKIAENDYGALGDTSTLADPSVVNELIDNRANR